MTERTPIDVNVTVYTGYNTSYSPKNVNVHFVQKRNQNLGMTKLKTPHGFEVNVYNLERITCDLINERNVGFKKENKFLMNMILSLKIFQIYNFVQFADDLHSSIEHNFLLLTLETVHS